MCLLLTRSFSETSLFAFLYVRLMSSNILTSSVNHGTFLHIAHEEGLISNSSSIHAGIRAPLGSRHRDLANDVQCGFDIITAREIDAVGIKGIIEKLRERVGDNRVYITVDIDVLDPVSFANLGQYGCIESSSKPLANLSPRFRRDRLMHQVSKIASDSAFP